MYLESEDFARLLRDNADIVVPIIKTNNTRSTELSVSGLLGLWLSGAVNAWGYSTQQDNWFWAIDNLKELNPDDMILRMDVGAASLGATYFRVELGQNYLRFTRPNAANKLVGGLNVDAETLPGGAGGSSDGSLFEVSPRVRRHRDLFFLMVRKGLFPNIKPGDLAGIPSVAFQRVTSLATTGKTLLQRHQLAQQEKGIFAWNANMQTPHDGYAPKYLFNLTQFAAGVVPATPYGYVATFPSWLDANAVGQVETLWPTDGIHLITKDGNLKGQQARSVLLDSVSAAAQEMPFRTENVFLSVIRTGENRYRLYAVDPGYATVADRDVRIDIHPDLNAVDAVDVLSGERVPVQNGAVNIHVPAGTFRIVDVRTNRKSTEK